MTEIVISSRQCPMYLKCHHISYICGGGWGVGVGGGSVAETLFPLCINELDIIDGNCSSIALLISFTM